MDKAGALSSRESSTANDSRPPAGRGLGNVAEFFIVMMDSEDDEEISMRLAILESISRHIVASYEQTHEH